ncbi:MAG: serine/threonine protein kinase [Proteobacteria bacterium]|nr:serine/threonine protein kinase [Pseudomonadota bacterium]
MESTPTLRDLFEEALGLPPGVRARLLEDRCHDAGLRATLERMLAADAEDGGLLPTGDAARAAQAIGETEPADPLPAGSRIGPFELLEVLGEGGSSTVFRAFREIEGVRQEVAVKLLARGLYTADARRRFHHERAALARLRHPGIARLIEGGIADNGLAYIALELIEGVPITRHVRERNLPERSRLTLFLKVCRAVESAHRALIVHRDLKPSNVLVTADGEVKLLDFGIAKLLDDTDGATRTRHHALTPAYAAPEQFTSGAITTATDVYALGVLLRELLTGERQLPGATNAQPSHMLDNALGPGTKPVQRRLRGDLANIAAKATAQEPERRYGSGGALADDIERYLDRLPVQAHPPSRWYRASRFVIRHRGGVAVTAILFLAILASLSIALWQAQVARREAQRANAIRDFVVGLLQKTAPDVAASQRPDVPTLVYAAADSLPKELREQPELRAELLYTLGNVLRDMRDIPRSEALLRQAEASAAALPANSSIRIQTEIGLIRTLIREGNYEEADRRIRPLLAIQAYRLPADVPQAMLLKVGMVIADGRGDMATAVARGRAMIAAYRSLCANDRHCDDLGPAAHDFASVLLDADRIAEARGLADEALARKQGHATPFSLADSWNLQAKIALYRGDLDLAEADALKADALLDSLGNGLHRKPLEPRTLHVYALLAKEDAAHALPLATALVGEQRARRASSCDLVENEIQQVRAFLQLQRMPEAVGAGQSAVAEADRCRDGVLHDLALALATLERGRTLAAAGDAAAAQVDYANAMALGERVHASDPLSWPLFLVDSMHLAQSLGHHDDAVRHARTLVAALDRAQALPTHPWWLEAQLVLVGTVPRGSTVPDIGAIDAAIAKIGNWPVSARLARMRAAAH